jgi:hypothetical protein
MFSFIVITKREWRFVIIWALAIVLITSLPIITGYLLSTPQKQFVGILSFLEDTHTYLAWMKQGQEGFILFEEKYTSEPHPRNVFLIYFLVTGWLSRITHIPLMATHQLMKAICGLTLLLTSYIFISYFLKEIIMRRISFILVSVAAGLGGYFAFIYHFLGFKLPGGWIPIDQYMPEAITFWSISCFAHLCLAISFMLMIFLLMLESSKQKNRPLCVTAGILALILVFFHPYDLITVVLALAMYWAYLAYIKKDTAARFNLTNFFIFFLIFSPGILLSHITLMNNPVLKQWLTKSTLASAQPLSYIFGFGLIFLAFVLGAWRIIKEKSEYLYFPFCWILAVAVLVYSPFYFQRRLVEGAHIPLCMLATVGILWVCQRFKWIEKNTLKKSGIIFLTAFILLTIPINLAHIVVDFRTVFKKDFPYFISQDFKNVLAWLDKNIAAGDIVLASRNVGNFIPPYAGAKVYIGHWAETLDHLRKQAVFKEFMQAKTGDAFRIKFLKENRISYFVFSDFEQRLGDFDPDNARYFTLIYETASIRIYKVNIGV